MNKIDKYINYLRTCLEWKDIIWKDNTERKNHLTLLDSKENSLEFLNNLSEMINNNILEWKDDSYHQFCSTKENKLI